MRTKHGVVIDAYTRCDIPLVCEVNLILQVEGDVMCALTFDIISGIIRNFIFVPVDSACQCLIICCVGELVRNSCSFHIHCPQVIC